MSPLWLALFLALPTELLPAQSGAIASWELTLGHLENQEFSPTKGHWKAKTTVPAEFLKDSAGNSALQFKNGTQWLTIHSNIEKKELPAKKWSASAWVAIDQPQTWGGIIGAFEDNGSYERGFLLGFRNRRFCVALATEKNQRLHYLTSEKDFSLGVWYHVAGVYNGRELLLYVDGKLAAKKTNMKGEILYADTHQFVLGSYKDQNENYPLHGTMASAAIYGKALNKKEVSRMAISGRKSIPEIVDGLAAGKVSGMGLGELQEQVHQAIDKGVEFLLRTQYRDGSWSPRIGSYRNGMTSLCVLALMESGIPKDHPAVRNALRFLGEAMPTKVYSAGLQLMAFAEADDPNLIPHMEAITHQILDWESRQTPGLWGYPSGRPDLSNAQFAALGLWSAHKKGIFIPKEVWERLVETAVTLCMKDEEEVKMNNKKTGSHKRVVEGFSYYARDTQYPAYGGMTAAGLGILALAEICHPQPSAAMKRLIKRGKDRALGWMEHNFRVDSVPGYAERLHYYLYGIERVGSLFNLKLFGRHDWYQEGAEFLVGDQAEDGRWSHQSQHHCATGFSLLFLNRATSPTSGTEDRKLTGSAQVQKDGAVKIRVTGKQTLTMWLASIARPDGMDHEKTEFQPVEASWILNEETIGTSPLNTSGDSRLAFRYTLPAPGNYQLRARVRFADDLVLESQAFAVVAIRSADVFHQQSLRFRGRNLLARARPTITASSKESKGNWNPNKVLDALQCTGWLYAKNDLKPWIEFKCPRSTKAERLILSPVDATMDEEGRTDTIHRVRVSLNDKDWVQEFDFPADPLAELEVSFGQSLRIKTVKIEVLERSKGTKWPNQGGFAEVALQ